MTKDIKYMRYFQGYDSEQVMFEELYSLENDPSELKNLIDQKDFQETKAKLIEKTNSYVKSLE